MMLNIPDSDNIQSKSNSSEVKQDNMKVSDPGSHDCPIIGSISHSKGCPPCKPPRRKYIGHSIPCKDTEAPPRQDDDSSISHSLSPEMINLSLHAEMKNSLSTTSHCEKNKDLLESEGVFSPEVNYFDGSAEEFLSLPKPLFSDQSLSWEKQCTSPQNSVVYNTLPFTNCEHNSNYNSSVHTIYHQNSLTSSFHNGILIDPFYTLPSYHSNSGVHSLPPFIHQYSVRDTGLDRNNENCCSHDFLSENLKKDDVLGNCMMTVNSLKLPCHRRHHSDPVLSWDHKLMKKSSLGKTTSHRSHSFVGISPKKTLRRMSIESLKNQQFNGIKHPILLHAELKALQDINEKLWQHLHSTQSQLDMMQKFKNPSKMDSTKRTQFSDLLAEIYYAQKERDQAIHARLHLITQERDTALNQLQQLLQCLGSGLKEDVDSSDDDDELEACFQDENQFLKMNLLPHQRVEKLLKHLEATQSPIRLVHQKETLLANVHKARDYRKFRLSQELRVILAERDAAMQKVRSLEEELGQWQHSNSIWQADTKQWETNLLDTLRQVIAERDVALTKVDELEEKLHLCYNLQSSFMGIGKQEKEEVELSQNADGSADAIQKTFGENTLITTLLQSSLNTEEKVDLQNEISTLNMQLETEKQARKAAEERYQRLERLVNVLQKRVNGLSVGVQV